MPKEQHDNYFERPKEVPVRRNPYYTGQGEEKEEGKEKQLRQQNEQLQTAPPGSNLVPMIRRHASEAGALPPDSKLSEKTKMENWKELEKEFKNRFKVLKKGNKSLTVNKLKGDTGSQYFISNKRGTVCNVIMGKSGIMLIAGPEEKSFRLSDKNDFFNRFDGLCSK